MLLRRFRPLLLRAWRLSLLVLAVVVIQKRQPSGMQSIAVERVRDFFPAAASLEEADGFQIVKDASGIALGLDRLVMLATGAAHIDEVLWTPFPIRG